eukprot:3670795-Prymnesium_polylepis.1
MVQWITNHNQSFRVCVSHTYSVTVSLTPNPIAYDAQVMAANTTHNSEHKDGYQEPICPIHGVYSGDLFQRLQPCAWRHVAKAVQWTRDRACDVILVSCA